MPTRTSLASWDGTRQCLAKWQMRPLDSQDFTEARMTGDGVNIERELFICLAVIMKQNHLINKKALVFD